MKVTLALAHFRRVLRAMLPFASKDATRSNIHSIHLCRTTDGRGHEGLLFVATDGHRLATVQVTGPALGNDPGTLGETAWIAASSSPSASLGSGTTCEPRAHSARSNSAHSRTCHGRGPSLAVSGAAGLSG